MNLFELFIKIDVDNAASEEIRDITDKIGKGFQKAAKIGMAAIAGLTTFAVKSFAEYEQLIGGVETLFKSSSKTIEKYAKNAYKTAGMSSLEYMSVATSFAASLLQSFRDTSGAITEEMADEMIDGLDRQVDAFENATDAQIKLINKQYTESLKLIDEEEYRRLKAIDDQIEAIESEEKAQEDAIKKRQQEERKAELQRLVDTAAGAENRMKAEQMLADYIQEIAEEERSQERKNQIAQLKDQKDAIKDEADLRRDALKEQHDYELEAYKEAREKELAHLKKHLKKEADLIKASIGQVAGDLSLPAEAYEKAAKVADMAITDMADNANKLGNSMESIQAAYSGFSKQNFYMLDNLRIGYQGNRSEMERLIADANAVKVANGEMGDLSIEKFADIVEAIHIIQTEMGITGTTSMEAEKTISGSARAMKSAFTNFFTSLADENANTGEAFDELKETTSIFLGNITPKLQAIWEGIGPIGQAIIAVTGAITGIIAVTKTYSAVTQAAQVIQALFNQTLALNPIGLIITLIVGLTTAIATLWTTNDGFREALTSAWEAIANTAQRVWGGVASFFTEMIPNAFRSVIDWFGNVGNWFVDVGKNIVNGVKNGISNAWKNLKKWFKNLFGDLIGIAKKILGIKSPSRVFKKIGAFTAEGFGIGFEDAFSNVERDIENALDFNGTTFGVKAYGSYSGGGIGGGTSFGTVNINIDGYNAQDDDELAEMIAEKLQTMTERRGAVFA